MERCSYETRHPASSAARRPPLRPILPLRPIPPAHPLAAFPPTTPPTPKKSFTDYQQLTKLQSGVFALPPPLFSLALSLKKIISHYVSTASRQTHLPHSLRPYMREELFLPSQISRSEAATRTRGPRKVTVGYGHRKPNILAPCHRHIGEHGTRSTQH